MSLEMAVEMISAKEARSRWGLVPSAINRYRNNGKVDYMITFGGKHEPQYLYSAADLAAIVARMRIRGADLVIDGRAVFSVKQIAEFFSVHSGTVRLWCEEGVMPATRTRTAWAISRAQLDEFIAGRVGWKPKQLKDMGGK